MAEDYFDRIYRENSGAGLERLPNANKPYMLTSVRRCPACGRSGASSSALRYSIIGGFYWHYICEDCGQKVKYDND